MYGITLNKQILFNNEFSIHVIKFEAWWQAFGIKQLRKSIQQHVMHFRYLKWHLVSYISESIWRMGFGNNFTTHILDRLHISNVKEAYQSTNKVNYIRLMLKHSDPSTGLDYMAVILS
jgi:hypothetical protein